MVAWRAGEAPYAYGAYFHQYLADQYGPERLSRLADATAGRLPLFGDGAFKTIFGRSSRELWADFRDGRERAAPAASATDAHAMRLTHAGYDVAALDVGDDGVIRYAVSDADRFPSLMELAPGGAPRRIAWRAGGTRTSAHGGWVIFDQLEMVRSIALYGDLYAVRAGGGRIYRLTHAARGGDPELSAQGGIVCTVLSSGHRALALVDFNPAVPRANAPRIIVDEPDGDYTGPRWSPDGRSIAAARRRPGSYDIVVIDPATRVVRSIASRIGARLVTPSWTPDGRTILFSANIGDAPFNVFAVDVATGAVRQVTETIGGAQFPTLSPSDILTYIGYTPDGYDVFSIATNTSDWKPVAFDSANPQTGSAGSSGSSGPTGSGSTGSGPTVGGYAPLRKLMPTYWQPVIRTDASETPSAPGRRYDALVLYTYSANAAWSGALARPDWDAS